MPMLRSDEILALDEVSGACKLAADHFDEFGRMTEDPDLQDLFDRLRDGHRQDVSRLHDQIRQMGELPKNPDPDREFVEHLANWLRAIVFENRRATLLDRAAQLEMQIRSKITAALASNLPDDAQALLYGIRNGTDLSLAWIQEAQSPEKPGSRARRRS